MVQYWKVDVTSDEVLFVVDDAALLCYDAASLPLGLWYSKHRVG
jgi:hypothetical protein